MPCDITCTLEFFFFLIVFVFICGLCVACRLLCVPTLIVAPARATHREGGGLEGRARAS